MRTLKQLILASLLLLFASSLSGCEPEYCGSTVSTKTDLFHTYRQNCAGCHGNQLEGVTGPALSNVGGKLSADQIKEMILKGGTGMPSFESTLSEAQIKSLVDYFSDRK